MNFDLSLAPTRLFKSLCPATDASNCQTETAKIRIECETIGLGFLQKTYPFLELHHKSLGVESLTRGAKNGLAGCLDVVISKQSINHMAFEL